MALASAWAFAAPSAFEARLDQLLALGEERPEDALAALAALPAEQHAQQRAKLFVRGLVHARSGREEPARAAAAELRRIGTPRQDADALAAAELVIGTLDDLQGRADLVDTHVRSAMQVLDGACRASVPIASGSCDPRIRWQALHLQQREAAGRSATDDARRLAQEVRELASRIGDPVREAASMASVAVMAARDGRAVEARALLGQAQALVRASGDTAASVRLALAESSVALTLGDKAEARRATEAGLAAARAAGLARAEAVHLVFLSDHEWRAGRPEAVLQAAEQALPTIRRFGDARAERALLHNMGLARIGLGRVAEGRRDIEAALALWERSGAHADASIALREYGQALAAQGDVAGALELFHRERAQHAEAMKHNRDAALSELQARFQRSAQERELELRTRDNQLRAELVANRERLQIVTGLVFVVAAMVLGLIVVLLQRMRRTQAELRRRQATLKVHSERDALTGLSNRRHFQQRMREVAEAGNFRGALLLVDIDHFKQVNDEQGHAAGDVVLVEVARRIGAAAGANATVARWGGEEFLVYAPLRDAAASDALAVRLLHAIGESAVPIGAGKSIAVTASIGHGRFPLAPHGVPLDWERALNLVDMALYSAKSHGRNQALGVIAAAATDAAALATIERDFELASQQGRVTLSRHAGPARPFMDSTAVAGALQAA